MQTGLGRTGNLWGVETFGVIPDILVTGKGLSGVLKRLATLKTNEKSDYPKWDMKIQVMPEKDAAKCPFNPFRTCAFPCRSGWQLDRPSALQCCSRNMVHGKNA
ncbi:MAG: aminotransferase class III-fold pyridoxal phosphate-dependent enzyme [bacterium]|nr:aminotransferase class III-fold pyridoxal phosphate-dependent enzyme [bacterium]